MRAPIVDSRMRGQIVDQWPSKCTIQQVTYTTSASRQQVPGGGTNLPGMVDIPARMSPRVIADVVDNEVRDHAMESEVETRILKLNGYFPNIVNRSMRAVVDGVVWQIRGVESDSQNFSTRLRVEIIRP